MKATVEKVLNLSNRPKTEGGRKAVPMGPRIIRNRVTADNNPKLARPAFLLEKERIMREERERMTTKAVTIRCMIFCRYMPLSPLTQGKREYPILHIHSIAIKRAIPNLKDLGFDLGTETQTATIDTRPQGPKRALS